MDTANPCFCFYFNAIGTGFSGGYHEYFGLSVDTEALTYLTLANYMVHKVLPSAITIAEVSHRLAAVK